MSNLEDRRNSPRREPPGPEWSIGVFFAGMFLCFGIAALAVAALLNAVVQDPPQCMKIANAMPIAGSCR